LFLLQGGEEGLAEGGEAGKSGSGVFLDVGVESRNFSEK
jgi:hypothetical protein